MQLFPVSATAKGPEGPRRATPYGELNTAAPPQPSLNPGNPLPARVLTPPPPLTCRTRSRWLSVSPRKITPLSGCTAMPLGPLNCARAGALLSTLPATPVPATVETPVEAPPPGASDTARTLCPLAESTT